MSQVHTDPDIAIELFLLEPEDSAAEAAYGIEDDPGAG